MADLTTLPAGAAITDVLAQLAVDGAVIVKDLLSADVVERFTNDIETTAATHNTGATTAGDRMAEFWGSETKRFTRLGWRSAAFEEILLAPTLIGVADELLLPHCDDYWMNTGQMMIIGPGETEQMAHRDAGNWMALCKPDSPEITVSCMYALGEYSAEMGATRVVPGSHLWDDFQTTPTTNQFATAEMEPGDGVIYTGRVIHNGGANTTTDKWRAGLHVSFVLGWLTPEEALPVSTPWEAASAMSERAQRLLGWGSYGVRSRLWTVDYEEVGVGLGFDDTASNKRLSNDGPGSAAPASE